MNVMFSSHIDDEKKSYVERWPAHIQIFPGNNLTELISCWWLAINHLLQISFKEINWCGSGPQVLPYGMRKYGNCPLSYSRGLNQLLYLVDYCKGMHVRSQLHSSVAEVTVHSKSVGWEKRYCVFFISGLIDRSSGAWYCMISINEQHRFLQLN